MCSNYVSLCHTHINCRSVGLATSTKIGNVNVSNICLFPLGMSPIAQCWVLLLMMSLSCWWSMVMMMIPDESQTSSAGNKSTKRFNGNQYGATCSSQPICCPIFNVHTLGSVSIFAVFLFFWCVSWCHWLRYDLDTIGRNTKRVRSSMWVDRAEEMRVELKKKKKTKTIENVRLAFERNYVLVFCRLVVSWVVQGQHGHWLLPLPASLKAFQNNKQATNKMPVHKPQNPEAVNIIRANRKEEKLFSELLRKTLTFMLWLVITNETYDGNDGQGQSLEYVLTFWLLPSRLPSVQLLC